MARLESGPRLIIVNLAARLVPLFQEPSLAPQRFRIHLRYTGTVSGFMA
ncbi:MAG TPA: hypothetical protein PLO63_10755 [Syntrophales bacterium]|nr:hypothetical protein [Syntrophales bacterium]